jgi:hypothetical protein
MPNPTRIEINCETGEVLEIELTDAEVAEMTYAAELAAEAKAEEERVAAEKAAARDAILARLGITADEAELLLG